MEKLCLKCEKPYKAKRANSKYCSDSCRVGFFNKNKKGIQDQPITGLQLQVLYNSLLQAISNIPTIENKNQTILISDKKEPQKKIQIKRSPANWVELRKSLIDESEYNEWRKELEAADYLTELERKQILATN